MKLQEGIIVLRNGLIAKIEGHHWQYKQVNGESKM